MYIALILTSSPTSQQYACSEIEHNCRTKLREAKCDADIKIKQILSESDRSEIQLKEFKARMEAAYDERDRAEERWV